MIDYKPLEEVMQEANDLFDKDLEELYKDVPEDVIAKYRTTFVFAYLKSTYNMLCLQVQKQNNLEAAKDIIHY